MPEAALTPPPRRGGAKAQRRKVQAQQAQAARTACPATSSAKDARGRYDESNCRSSRLLRTDHLSNLHATADAKATGETPNANTREFSASHQPPNSRL